MAKFNFNHIVTIIKFKRQYIQRHSRQIQHKPRLKTLSFDMHIFLIRAFMRSRNTHSNSNPLEQTV